MSLKTATLVALIGVIIDFGLRLLSISGAIRVHRLYYWILPLIIFHGSLILFLAVFYTKQGKT